MLEQSDDSTTQRPVPLRLGDFEIIRELGRGGMGTVYEARQISLKRKVALKVMGGGLGASSSAVGRFEREAEAAAKLHHTHIVPIYATGEQDGVHYYAMELMEGSSLDHVLRDLKRSTNSAGARDSSKVGAAKPAEPFPAPLGQTLDYKADGGPTPAPAGNSSTWQSGSNFFDTVARVMADVADALAYAHKQGVIHRDIKPSNLILGADGGLRITDFGLARILEQPGMTMTGEFVGSPLYMSPEQIAAGRIPIDHRTDIYSLGATLYQLLTLHPPFPGENREQVIAQILCKDPKPLRRLNRKIPADLETICLKALEKDPDRRYQTAEGMAEDLRCYLSRMAISARRRGPVTRLVKFARRHWFGLAAGLVLSALGLAAAIMTWKFQAEKTQGAANSDRAIAEVWLRKTAIPAIRRLIKEQNYGSAFYLAEEAEQRIPGDPTLGELRPEFSASWSVVTDPPGARVYVKMYRDLTGEWRYVGTSPIDRAILPRGCLLWRMTKDGYSTVEGCRDSSDANVRVTLDAPDNLPRRMVRVSGNEFRLNLNGTEKLETIDLEDFFIDRCEVTNRQFKEFVNVGGYQRREFWKEEFVKGDGVLTWDKAMDEFRDTTGKPGPATWRLGTFPPGEDNFPVGGVSWHEAAAYAEFTGKSLPTVTHWIRASGIGYQSEIIKASNFGESGPMAVGTGSGIGPGPGTKRPTCSIFRTPNPRSIVPMFMVFVA